MKNVHKRIVAIILVVAMSIVGFAIPASAIDSEGILECRSSVYDIEVDGIIFNVVITPNPDGTRNILVEGNGTTLSWSTKATESEAEPFANNVSSNRYGSYRYTFCETAAVPWYLYRPLQDDGSASTKGIGYADSEFARRFADQVKNMVRADALISQYLEINEFVTHPVTEVLLGALGDIVLFKVAKTMVASVIAGAIGRILEQFNVPTSLEDFVTELVEEQYNNIADYIATADNYFDLA